MSNNILPPLPPPPCEPFPECLAPPVNVTIGEQNKEESSLLTTILIAAVPTIIGGYLLHLLTKDK